MTEAQLLADRLRYLSQRPVGLKESLEIVDSLPRIVAMLDLVACPNPAEIGNAIIAGIADGDTALEKMAAVVDHLRLAGFVIVPINEPRYLGGCLQDGECRGVCRNFDCPNYGMVVAARVCVEPQEADVLYPTTEGVK